MQNKYTNWYNKLIQNGRRDKPAYYAERHHVIPRCLGGSDETENLVYLSARQHYIAHLLLTKMVDGNARYKIWWAFHRMLFSNGGSRAYDFNRRRWAKWISENHASKRPETMDLWRQQVSERVSSNWVDNEDRRIKTAKQMAETNRILKEKDADAYYKHQRINARKGAIASKEKNASRLEYKGKVYLGYTELEEQTGITKHLYKKLYAKGYDPEFRKGKDGPMTNEEIEELTGQFCHKSMIDYPITPEMWSNTLDRMVNIGLISRHICDRFLKSKIYTGR